MLQQLRSARRDRAIIQRRPNRRPRRDRYVDAFAPKAIVGRSRKFGAIDALPKKARVVEAQRTTVAAPAARHDQIAKRVADEVAEPILVGSKLFNSTEPCGKLVPRL
jgi:hypothetical protein